MLVPRVLQTRAGIRTAVHVDTTKSRPVAANPLDDDARTVLNGSDEISCV